MPSIKFAEIKSKTKDAVRSTLFKEFILFSFSTFLVQGSRFTVSVIAAKNLGPSTWGIWQLLYLILAYSSIFHLGITNGMNREIPILSGREDDQTINTIRSISFGTVLLAGIIAGAAIFGSSKLIEDGQIHIPLKFMILLLVAYLIYTYLEVYLRSSGWFNHMSQQQIFFSITFLALVTPAVLKFHLNGYILSQAAVILLTILFIFKITPVRLQIKFDLRESFRLIKIGFPIMIGMILFTFMMTADRWVIATFLNLNELGYYSLSIMVLRGLTLIPRVISQQIFPRLAKTWGSTSKYEDLTKWIRVHIVMCLCLTTPVILLAFLFFPLLVRNYMPEFVPGITAMKISLIVPFFFGLSTVFVNLLNTIGKQLQLMLIRGAALLFDIVLNIIFVKMGLGINGIALGTALTFVLYYLAVAAFGKSAIRSVQQKNYLKQIKTANV